MTARECILCGRPEPFEPVFERDGFQLVRCPGCRLVFQHPQPKLDDLGDAYYFSEEFAQRLEGDLRATTVARAREKLPLVLGAGLTAAGHALDVGCSTGAWLEVAGEAGWTPTGLELGEHLAAAARRRGFEVHQGRVEERIGALDGGEFDLITFWDVLEHLEDPVAALRGAAALLAPGGSIAFTFPNVEGWYPRATYRALARTTGVWEYPELPVHLYDFSPATAARLAGRAALDVTHHRTMAIPYDFYRSTTLPGQLAPRGRRGRLLAAAFGGLRLAIYPVARAFDRGNAQFLVTRLAAS
jgi:SAM-dependent methyltransferase